MQQMSPARSEPGFTVQWSVIMQLSGRPNDYSLYHDHEGTNAHDQWHRPQRRRLWALQAVFIWINGLGWRSGRMNDCNETLWLLQTVRTFLCLVSKCGWMIKCLMSQLLHYKQNRILHCGIIFCMLSQTEVATCYLNSTVTVCQMILMHELQYCGYLQLHASQHKLYGDCICPNVLMCFFSLLAKKVSDGVLICSKRNILSFYIVNL